LESRFIADSNLIISFELIKYERSNSNNIIEQNSVIETSIQFKIVLYLFNYHIHLKGEKKGNNFL